MTPVPELNDLVATVDDRCPSGTELDRLRAASDVAREVGRVGEDLVTHFVDQARAGGASWADIGDVLGVSRQGAHQRHHDRPRPDRWWRGDFGRFSPGAIAAIKGAAIEARTAGNTFIGSEHLLLGVLAVPGNRGVAALQRCGADPSALRAATVARLTPAGQDPTEPLGHPFGRPRAEGANDDPNRGGRGRRPCGRLPFTASARRVFDLTMGATSELGGESVGCENLLIALAGGDGPAAEVLAEAGITATALTEAVRAIASEQPAG